MSKLLKLRKFLIGKVMFAFIKQWKERRRRKSILKDIKKAKNIYISCQTPFMCHCFMLVDFEKYENPEQIRQRIPEFKPETFHADKPYHYPWWPPIDREPRIKAFDKLIEIYSK